MKNEVKRQLEELEVAIKNNFGGHKADIVRQVTELARQAKEKRGGKEEGKEEPFIKKFLYPILENTFGNDCIVEGMESLGRTQFKNKFFGTAPAIDFIVGKSKLLGEVKFEEFRLSKLTTALGQALFYIAASKIETTPCNYGCVIFFDSSLKFKGLSNEETKFKNDLWDNNNVYFIIV